MRLTAIAALALLAIPALPIPTAAADDCVLGDTLCTYDRDYHNGEGPCDGYRYRFAADGIILRPGTGKIEVASFEHCSSSATTGYFSDRTGVRASVSGAGTILAPTVYTETRRDDGWRQGVTGYAYVAGSFYTYRFTQSDDEYGESCRVYVRQGLSNVLVDEECPVAPPRLPMLPGYPLTP